MDFCEKLRALREERGISAEKLAEDIGAEVAAVAAWESGEITPDRETIGRVAEYFAVEESYFYEADDYAKKQKATHFPYYLGFMLCIAGFVCLIVWGLLMIAEPSYTFVYKDPSRFNFDKRVILLIACADLVLTGLVLLFRKPKRK
ncbi:MAG: helix-turn-helix transcriptional regulator [Clostridia bacterium]|nr:helix-turn-helix transcriptional regulator [Clostridia bacterium]